MSKAEVQTLPVEIVKMSAVEWQLYKVRSADYVKEVGKAVFELLAELAA